MFTNSIMTYIIRVDSVRRQEQYTTRAGIQTLLLFTNSVITFYIGVDSVRGQEQYIARTGITSLLMFTNSTVTTDDRRYRMARLHGPVVRRPQSDAGGPRRDSRSSHASDVNWYSSDYFVCLLVGCLTSQQQASVSQGRICSDNFTCYHTEIEVADPTFYLTQSQYTDTGPTSPSADPITPGAWQGSHWSANF